jgi:hypothetical protein
MSYPRTPLAKAKSTGQTLKNPKRFKSRKEPSSRPLGKPSAVLVDELEVRAWQAFQAEVPWLTEADRATVEAASMMRAKLWGGSRDEKVVGRLLSLLSRMGATPADRSKVYAPPEEDEDPAAAYLQ